MSRRVLQNKELLKFLHDTNTSYRKAILKSADKNLIHCICECVHNTLQGKLRLSPQQKKKLLKYKSLLRKIARRGDSVSFKKKIIVQKGGAFLPLVLAPLISGVLSSLFFNN